MSNPLDATPMQLREELAIVWSIVEQEKEFSSRLKKALTEREKQIVELLGALKETVVALEHRWEVIANRAAPVMESVIDAAHTRGIQALASTKDLSGLVLCEAEPVAWMQDNGCYFSVAEDEFHEIPLFKARKA